MWPEAARCRSDVADVFVVAPADTMVLVFLFFLCSFGLLLSQAMPSLYVEGEPSVTLQSSALVAFTAGCFAAGVVFTIVYTSWWYVSRCLSFQVFCLACFLSALPVALCVVLCVALCCWARRRGGGDAAALFCAFHGARERERAPSSQSFREVFVRLASAVTHYGCSRALLCMYCCCLCRHRFADTIFFTCLCFCVSCSLFVRS